MTIRDLILNLKTIINVADVPAAVDAVVAELDTAALVPVPNPALDAANAALAVAQASLVRVAYDEALKAAADRLDFEEVARLMNKGSI